MQYETTVNKAYTVFVSVTESVCVFQRETVEAIERLKFELKQYPLMLFVIKRAFLKTLL